MKLNLKAFALTTGILWGAAMLLTGLANLIWTGYGVAFLQLMASLYPGYHADGTIVDLVMGVLYALVDGAIAGLVFGWLYNVLVGKRSSA